MSSIARSNAIELLLQDRQCKCAISRDRTPLLTTDNVSLETNVTLTFYTRVASLKVMIFSAFSIALFFEIIIYENNYLF